PVGPSPVPGIGNGDTPTGPAPIGAEVPAGQARLTVADLAVGEHEIHVEYAGDANCTPSSATLHQSVGRPVTRTTLTSSAVAAAFGEIVTLEATVRGEARGVPTGTVTFRDGTTP